MRNMIKEWLKKHHIVYDQIFFSKDKTKEIQELEIDVMIEDSPETTVTIVDIAQLIQQLGAVRKETVTVGQQEALVGSARGMRLTGKDKRDSQITIINESLSENRGEPIRRRGNLIAK